ncbi:MAG: YCF48-related protein [Lentimicrobium sp.]
MRKLIILLVALVSMNGAMGQWFPQNSGTTNNLNSVYLTDVNTGYVVGDSGIILKSIDGGNSWAIQSSGTFANLFSVQFTDSLTGYAVGDSSIILKTIDGGDNWVNQSVGVSADFSSVSFPTADTGYVVGFYWDWLNSDTLYNYILKTTNGGNLWTTSYLYKTTDDVGEPYVKSVFFPDVNTGYAVGAIGSMMYYPYLVKTIDGGMNWTSQVMWNFMYYGILSSHFLNIDTGYVVGYGGYSSLKTINGGNDWTGLISNDFSTHYSVYFIDSERGYLVGGESWSNGNIIEYTEDGGNVWITQYSDNLPGNYLLSVNFANDTTGYAVGTNGTILKTTNGGGSPGCLPEGITFSTQEQIDNFQNNYPGCTEIEGDVTIEGWNITNLNGLNLLTSIGGYLKVRYNSSLTSLTGLDNLTSIGGGLQVGDYDYGNPALTSLSGLDNLISIGGNMFIGYNPELTDLTGLESVTSLQGDLTITGNNSLTNCAIQNICNLLNAPNGVVEIYNNGSGCNSQSEVVNACGGSAPCLPYGHYYLLSQADVDNFQENFPACNDLEGNLTITGNSIVNLTGLNQVYSIGGSVSINYCDNLENLNGLENLYTIGGSFSLHDNHRIKDFSGLENLDSIGALVIGWTDDGGSGGPIPGGNDSLVSLSSLSNLTYVRGIEIGQNPSLISLAGLDSINANTLVYVAIGLNSSLSTCEVQSICDYLAAPNAYIIISDNAPGCNSPEEVEAACAVVGVEEVAGVAGIRIIPNPARDMITVSLPMPTGTAQLTLFNITGKKLLERQITRAETHIYISKLPKGMYFLRLQYENNVKAAKIIKD